MSLFRRCAMDYMTLMEACEKWNISPRRINYYCSAGRIPGAEKKGTVWLIPYGVIEYKCL